MNNKKLGTEFERKLCKQLSERGFWVHFLTPDNRGTQPFDIIAVKDGFACAFECKTLSDSARYFPIDRLEDNQILAFEKWIECGNVDPIIAVEYKEKVYSISFSELKENGKIDMQEREKVNEKNIINT